MDLAIPNTVEGVCDPRYGRDPQSLREGFLYHITCDLGVERNSVTERDHYVALALAVRDRLMKQWIRTQTAHYTHNAKRVYYLSLEFLIGRSLGTNVINMGLEDSVRAALKALDLDWNKLRDIELDAGLGNGGLGRLAACFMESLATLEIPAVGYGLRYEYGIFRQEIQGGYQVEEPDPWLKLGDPWEICRPHYRVPVHFGGRIIKMREGGKFVVRWIDTHAIEGIAYDRPVVGFGGSTVNTLRLWRAAAADDFDFEDFNKGDYIAAVESKVHAENLTKVLYPNDNVHQGKELRLRQQYFFVACSLYDIIRRFKKTHTNWNELPDMAAIQLNDTHPALAVPELMRLLIDQEGLEWDHAWDITQKTLAYTNHTLMPEALEKWPVDMLERLLPRHLDIIYTINHQFLTKVQAFFPGDPGTLAKLSLIEERPYKQVRMANMCIVGSHSTNGVAALHTELLKSRVVPEFAQMFPERFNNKTNGVTPRRWLLKANPPLADLISEAIGDGWICDLSQLRQLEKFADDASFRRKIADVKRQAKLRLVDFAAKTMQRTLNPDSLFDVQIKRIHEYKRQTLNALHIVVLYNRLRKNPGLDVAPRTFLFAGKAAPGYFMAKLIIKLVNSIAEVVNNDPAVNSKLQVHFLPNYSVSLAERLIPAAELSEQISTAGTEASGTGNMKFMINGAMTIGTMDGANIEIVEEVGRENAFIFGLNAEEVADLRRSYNPWQYYQGHAETREALDLIFSDAFSRNEPGIFEPLKAALLHNGDHYMNLAELSSYAEAHEKAQKLYHDQDAWSRMSLLNTARSGKFSSDRTIRQYAEEIWKARSVHVR